ncbi:FAD:protein FMN transferase [Enterovirga aerilata]|uniref:FAD:protein FMN transferase n=1 Tax=Enterovirga aerilata TaxID=2730920 RepID=A0A849ID64_9HYPH|nr:FAD:protein FMN transferase [Enterovirga sp. DB1703]NNM74359.1 FAD:protein FMN transferase [Enterovirga sp. DB1703]
MAARAAAPARRVLVPPVAGPLLRPAPGPVRTLAGAAMGTGWSVKLAGRPDLSDGLIRGTVQRALDRVIAQMSGWEAGSDLSRYNAAPPGTWHDLPEEFLLVLRTALRIAEVSEGAFDPTLGALVGLWGFGPPGPRPGLPDPEALAQSRHEAGWRRLRLDGSRLLQPGGLALDLSGIAKGFAVDLVAAELRQLGLASFLVEIGGELRGEGVKPDLSPWWVALETPPGAAGLPTTLVALHGLSVATSGEYRRFRDVGGTRLSHTLDPATGAPSAAGVLSASVVHGSCMEADGWATALAVLGPEAGLALAAREGLAARILHRQRDRVVETCTPALERLAD